MRRMHLASGLLFVAAALLPLSLAAREPAPEGAPGPSCVWGSLQLGGFSGLLGSGVNEMVGIYGSLSAQFKRNVYGTVYLLSASHPFGEGDSVTEFGIQTGCCRRTRRSFIAAAVGLGVARGRFGWGDERADIGVPLELEGALNINGFVAISLRYHAFISRRAYGGYSLGLQLGKLR